MIKLAPLSVSNFDAAVALQVDASQSRFVASNVYSIAESKVYPYLVPMVITADDAPVGFAMFGQDPESGRAYLVRFMIDGSQQQKGFGRSAGSQLIERIRGEYGMDSVFLSLVPGNDVAERLYRSLGLAPTGETDDDGEIVYELRSI